jgi:hypothetical protein
MGNIMVNQKFLHVFECSNFNIYVFLRISARDSVLVNKEKVWGIFSVS